MPKRICAHLRASSVTPSVPANRVEMKPMRFGEPALSVIVFIAAKDYLVRSKCKRKFPGALNAEMKCGAPGMTRELLKSIYGNETGRATETQLRELMARHAARLTRSAAPRTSLS